MPSWDAEPWIPGNAAALAGVVGTAGVTGPPGLAADLDRIGTAGGDTYGAFTPGDTCPDNNLITPQGLRLIDFEAACYQSVFLTAAYCSMPFSTCWCVFRLPAGMGETLEEVYRREVVDAYPELAEDAVWRAGMQQALAVWTVDATVRLLPRAATEDLPMHRTRRPVPTMRQVLLHRWEAAGRLTGYPAFADTFRRLLRRTAAAWDVPPLPHYPAFTAPGPGPVSGPGPASAR
jgi:hypothetical protein